MEALRIYKTNKRNIGVVAVSGLECWVYAIVINNFKTYYNMKFNFENLDQKTRDLMISEIKIDIDNNQHYISKRFNEKGNRLYVDNFT